MVSFVISVQAILGLLLDFTNAYHGQSSIDRYPLQTHLRSCPSEVSCQKQTRSIADTCCMNSPSGHFLLTQFWDTNPPLGAKDSWTIHGLWPDYCTGGFEQFCDDDRALSPQELSTIISQASKEQRVSGRSVQESRIGLLDFMTEHWLSLDSRNANLWAHEWNKHGTCISTLEPRCYPDLASNDTSTSIDALHHLDVLDYFTHTVLLYTTLPTFDFLADHGIFPTHDRTYTLAELQIAVRESTHNYEATFKCRNGQLDEIWYHFNTRGSLRLENDWRSGEEWHKWVAASPDGQRSNCPSHGIHYLPKRIKDPPPHHTTPHHDQPSHTRTSTSAAPTSTNSGAPFTGKGHLMVKVVSENDEPSTAALDGFDGCLIRKGTWFGASTTSQCATFRASDDLKLDDPGIHLFTLESRYAPCAFARDNADKVLMGDGLAYFLCDRDMKKQGIFSASTNQTASDVLMYGSIRQDSFFAPRIPQLNRQEQIWTSMPSDDEGVEVTIHWKPLP